MKILPIKNWFYFTQLYFLWRKKTIIYKSGKCSSCSHRNWLYHIDKRDQIQQYWFYSTVAPSGVWSAMPITICLGWVWYLREYTIFDIINLPQDDADMYMYLGVFKPCYKRYLDQCPIRWSFTCVIKGLKYRNCRFHI